MKKFLDEVKETFQVHKVYRARWVWYHTIMAIELLIIIIILTGILIKI